MILILSFLWFIRTTKVILFYLYFWQLKEYRIGRFLDHFRTEKGKKLLFNKLVIFKVFLLVVWIAMGYISVGFGFFDMIHDFILIFSVVMLFVVYFFEGIKAVSDCISGKFLKPVFTRKIQFLIFILLAFTVAFLLFMILSFKRPLVGLLAFDVLTPLIVSAIIFIFQPLAVLRRNQIIKKAKRKRAEFKDLLVVGITGSYGKTSTKEFLATILSEKFNILKTKEHQNTEIGVSQCILNDLQPEHEIFICEMGAYKRGEIKLLGDITKPKIGILTGINEQHLAIFGSQENIIKAKYELIESLPEDGLAIFNGDNEYCLELYKKTLIEKKIYSLQSSISGKPSGIWAHNVKTEKDFISFKIFSMDSNPPSARGAFQEGGVPAEGRAPDSADFKVNIFGAQNVLNILGAVAVAKELGMSFEEIARACQKIEPGQSGTQLKKGINGLNIIDASYSANPTGVISHLDYLKIWGGKKVIIMPCLIELGSSTIEVHKRIGQKIGEVCNLAIITTKERFKEIKEGVPNALFIENPKEILEKIKSFCQEGDVVLLESRVPRELMKQLTIVN